MGGGGGGGGGEQEVTGKVGSRTESAGEMINPSNLSGRAGRIAAQRKGTCRPKKS